MALDLAKIQTVITLLETLKRTSGDLDEDTAERLDESIIPLRLIVLGSTGGR